MARIRGPLGMGLVLLVTFAAGVGVGGLAFGGDDGDSAETVAGPTTTAAPDGEAGSSTTSTTDAEGGEGAEDPPGSPRVPVEGLSGEALAFAEALNAARDMNYHARYETERTESDGTRTEVLVEVWRRNPLARRDFTVTGGERQVVSREYKTSGGVTGCLDTSPDGADDFQCTDATASGSDPAAPAFGAADPHDGEVTAHDDTVDGRAVRCYRLAALDKAPVEVCFDDAGIPIVVDDGDYRLVRTALDDDITDDVFTPPPV